MFETEHLILRRFIERDLHALYLIYSDKEANRFLPWFPATNIDDARSIFDSRYADPAAFTYAVCLKADAYPIGYVNIGNEEPYDLGYGLRKEFWHRGIMTEAVSWICELAFSELDICRITGLVFAENTASARVLEKNGFALAVAPVGRCAARRCCGGHAASRMRARNPDGSEFTPSRSRVPARTLRARSFRKARDD